jgi:hypothetical protein
VAAQHLADLLAAPAVDRDELKRAFQPFRGRSERTTDEQLAEAMRVLTATLPKLDIERPGYAAMWWGEEAP